MFGIDFPGHPYLVPLLLPDGFEGHPLRKDFVLATRALKSWPGAKEPGESEHEGAPSRRKMQPPGVPDPATWGPRPPGTPPARSRRVATRVTLLDAVEACCGLPSSWAPSWCCRCSSARSSTR